MKKFFTVLILAAITAAGCRSSNDAAAQPAHAQPATASVAAGGTVNITVDAEGYHPATVRAPAGAQITLAFRRTTDECCGQQLKIPSMNLQRDLPLNQTVPIAVTVPGSGQLAFTCGMNMYQGSVVVN